jgi:alkanesulfonate monooxygenase SsuD/methylene tetrahydromethanopterin reductase-like flavin-dependent oxidoreductase (luciferase family)
VDLGICAASDITDIDYAVTAERLGYSSFWAGDSQLLWSDCYATLALVADRTSTLRIGPGIAVAGTRPVSVTAGALATLDRIAPGRVFAGVGAGNTAMRVAGLKPVTTAALERYVTDLRTLVDGGEIISGDGTRVRHLMPRSGFVALEPRMPLHVSGFGPKAMAVAARHGDGLVLSIPPYPEEVTRVWDRLRAAGGGRDLDPTTFRTTLLTTLVVLDPGQPRYDADVVRQAGAYAIVSMHYA